MMGLFDTLLWPDQDAWPHNIQYLNTISLGTFLHLLTNSSQHEEMIPKMHVWMHENSLTESLLVKWYVSCTLYIYVDISKPSPPLTPFDNSTQLGIYSRLVCIQTSLYIYYQLEYEYLTYLQHGFMPQNSILKNSENRNLLKKKTRTKNISHIDKPIDSVLY